MKRERPDTVYIYTLNDPRNDEVRYVGRTIRPQERLYGHVTHSVHLRQSSRGGRDAWICELWDAGLTPYMVIIDEVPYSERREAENKWAKYYHERGARLTIEPLEMKRMGLPSQVS